MDNIFIVMFIIMILVFNSVEFICETYLKTHTIINQNVCVGILCPSEKNNQDKK